MQQAIYAPVKSQGSERHIFMTLAISKTSSQQLDLGFETNHDACTIFKCFAFIDEISGDYKGG